MLRNLTKGDLRDELWVVPHKLTLINYNHIWHIRKTQPWHCPQIIKEGDMAMYGLSKKYKTKAEHSVDHKEHNRKLWYSGTMDILGMTAPVWSTRKDRVLFNTKAEAQKVLRWLNKYGDIITIEKL